MMAGIITRMGRRLARALASGASGKDKRLSTYDGIVLDFALLLMEPRYGSRWRSPAETA